MAMLRCKACGEHGVKVGAKVCQVCHTNQKKFADEESEEMNARVESAAAHPWVSWPIGLLAAFLGFAFGAQHFEVLGSSIVAFIAFAFGFTYSMAILGISLLVGALYLFSLA